jgi:mRNA (guanine-N7-)-methyltransferase
MSSAPVASLSSLSDRLFDLVSCPRNIANHWGSIVKAHAFISNVASLLKSGGYFFGITLDGSAVWSAVQKKKKKAQLDNVKLRFHSVDLDFLSSSFQPFGTQLIVNMPGFGSEKVFLVHPPTLIALAKHYGLFLVEMLSLPQYMEEVKEDMGELYTSLRTQKTEKGRIIPEHQMEAAALYCVYIFQKL